MADDVADVKAISYRMQVHPADMEDMDGTVPRPHVNDGYVWSSSDSEDGTEIPHRTPEQSDNVVKDDIQTEAVVNGGSGNKMKNKAVDENKDTDLDEYEACGLGFIQSGCCQRFRTTKWFLFIFTLCGAVQGMTINAAVNAVISTIEKRFELSSTESGLISSFYDIMFVLLVIPVSYFGGHGNKPRYLGVGMIVLGLGSFVFSLPHFLTGKYEVVNAFETICDTNKTSLDSCDSGNEGLSDYKYLFFLGQLLHGAGATTIHTLGLVYIDENVSQVSSSTYHGIFFIGVALGPAFGYALTSEFLKIYTDIGEDPDELGINVHNPKWVGAWWIPFVLASALALILSLPMLAFPRALPGSKKFALERGKERQEQKGVDTTGQHIGIKDILLSIKLLLTNVPFMLINTAIAFNGLLMNGLSTFIPKIIEYQFGLSTSDSALYIGMAIVPAGGGGTFLGGFLVSYFKMKVKTILRMATILTLFLLGFMLCFLFHCQTGNFVGVTTPYQSQGQLRVNGSSDDTESRLISSCNRNCNCQEEDYFPMCGRDGQVYFSPCYAGCTRIEEKDNDKFYYDCHCLDYNYTIAHSFKDKAYEGELGKCKQSCKWFSPFMVVFSGMIIVICLCVIPFLASTLRCVPDHQRSFGLGIQMVYSRCLGTIPGPLLFGKMFDIACRVWQKRCNGSGSCYFYDNDEMRINLVVVCLALGAMICFSLFLACWFYKAVPTSDVDNVELKRSKDSLSQTSTPRDSAAPDSPKGPYVIDKKSVFV